MPITMNIKEKLHALIDNVDDPARLESWYHYLFSQQEAVEGGLWNQLQPDQKFRLLQSFEESESVEILIPHDAVMRKHRRS